MPTLFVGIHAALAGLITLFGVTFVANPCGGGGDLCLGWIGGLFAFGTAGLGALGIAIWRARRWASPLLIWDCALVALAGYILYQVTPYGPGGSIVGAQAIAVFGLPGAVVAGRAVVAHRIERLVAVAALAGIAIVGGVAGILVLVLGLLALGVGWLFARRPVPNT